MLGGGGGGTGVGAVVCLFFFQFSGRLAFVKMYNFLQVVVLKNAALWVSFVQMRSFGMKKKNDEQEKSRFSREVKSRRIHCTISW